MPGSNIHCVLPKQQTEGGRGLKEPEKTRYLTKEPVIVGRQSRLGVRMAQDISVFQDGGIRFKVEAVSSDRKEEMFCLGNIYPNKYVNQQLFDGS